jgi:hypothetical protein
MIFHQGYGRFIGVLLRLQPAFGQSMTPRGMFNLQRLAQAPVAFKMSEYSSTWQRLVARLPEIFPSK